MRFLEIQRLRKIIGAAAAGLVLSLVTQSAHAVLINSFGFLIDTGFSSFSAAATGSQLNTDLPGNPPQLLEWGTDVGNGQSSLELTDPPAGTIFTNDLTGEEGATITHTNVPIGPPALTEATILQQIELTDGGTNTFTSTINIQFLETPNLSEGETCLDGSIAEDNGCPDIFVVTDPGDFLFNFVIDDFLYTLAIIDFPGVDPVSDDGCLAVVGVTGCVGFVTPENMVSEATAIFILTAEERQAPEPGTVGLVALGLIGIGFAATRRKRIRR